MLRRRFSILLVGAEIAGLLAIAVVIGSFQVRSHCTSIWMDAEFTGWVTPIANRLAHGTILYSDGGHSPMPPLPFLLLYWLTHGNATWLTESLWNFFFQSGIAVVMFVGLRRYFERPIPFLAAALSLPLYYALPKTIVYDAMAQFLVATAAMVIARCLDPTIRHRKTMIVIAGGLTALTLLSKQNTGAGLAAGGVIVVAALSENRRATLCLWYIASTLVFILGFSLTMVHHISLKGLVVDVFLTGAEPKGGLPGITQHLLSIGMEIVGTASCFLVGAGILMVLFPRRDGGHSLQAQVYVSWITSLVAAVLIVLCLTGSEGIACSWAPTLVVWAGLFLLMWNLSIGALPKPIAGSFVILFLSAVAHSTSVNYFRLTYDNNPLIGIAIAAFLSSLFAGRDLLKMPSRTRHAITAVALAIAGLSVWMYYLPQCLSCWDCTEQWPEVSYLAGARLHPWADGMRQLVRNVRSVSRSDEEVLLLPNDPNVESWWDRPRPMLSSAIVFVDQYWDRYIEEDVKRLERKPPKVIVIGPRNFWRAFHFDWAASGQRCERLIDLVGTRLLARYYRLERSQEICHMGRPDYMDVYVLKESPQ